MSRQTKYDQFAELVRLVPKIYFKLNALTSELLKDSGVSPGQRALMEDLEVLGPQTVGALARARPVAKQYVQKLVSDLAVLDLVQLEANPEDGRSKIVSLSKRGARTLAQWRRGEKEAIEGFLRQISAQEVAVTWTLLKKLHMALDEALE